MPVDTAATLDPTDWEALRPLGHQIVDDLLAFQRDIAAQRIWTRPSEDARAAYREPLPVDGEPLATIYDQFRRHVLPYGMGNYHPRFWGWVNGQGTPGGMLAMLMEGGMNNHTTFGDQSGIHIERQIIRWCAQLLGLPTDSSGILGSSGSLAQLTALIIARDNMLPTFSERGATGQRASPVVYASAEVHNSVDKALAIIGLGREGIRRIPVNRRYEVETAALEAEIRSDQSAGRMPIAIVGCAGTVNTGAVDDLATLADIAEQHRLWFHVDAAFGAALATSSTHKRRLTGIERADSVAFDFHKWFNVPYDAACTLIRSGRRHRESFSPPAAYLGSLPGGVLAGGEHFGELGPDLSRGFRALRVWVTLKEQGIARIGTLVDQNIADTAYLASLVDAHPDLELMAPADLNVAVFRYIPYRRAAFDLNDLNRRILMTLQDRGLAIPSFTTLQGRFGIRVANVNHRTRRTHFDELIRDVVSIGAELATLVT